MEKSKNLILIQAFLLLCAFVLPFISVYCQEYRKSTPKRTLIRKRPVRRSVTRPSAQVSIPKPAEESIKETDIAEAQTEPTIATDTKQAQAATQAPDTWAASIYKTFTIVLLNSLYKGSETGIGALTKIVIKRFIERRDALADREALEEEKKELEPTKTAVESLLTEEGANYLKTLPIEKRIAYQATIKNTLKKADDLLIKENKLEKLEKETSLPAIAATGVYMGILNTAVPMMGIVMGTAVKLALQMLMPAEQ